MKKQTVICQEYKKDNKTYIQDYRLKNDIEIVKGKLSDLKEWYYKSNGLGDLLGTCANLMQDNNNLVIVNYGKKYALGIKEV